MQFDVKTQLLTAKMNIAEQHKNTSVSVKRTQGTDKTKRKQQTEIMEITTHHLIRICHEVRTDRIALYDSCCWICNYITFLYIVFVVITSLENPSSVDFGVWNYYLCN
jgi:hypothetical protein